ncbi:hypothetical protein H7X65_00455 [Candidatus Parcubacteria bacterium]|nr:hypothetical protein [Candidatus Parcubacteria bacterium]
MNSIFKTIVTGIVYPVPPYKVGEVARDMLDRLAHRSMLGMRAYDLVRISVAELGFTAPVSRKMIYTRIEELGLVLCPQSFGRLLRVLYPEQPQFDGLIIGMNPVIDSEGNPQLFTVGHGPDGLWLSAVSGLEDVHWASLYEWVFVKPRK